jgi:transcriptional regulator with XRE-family HTH domain
MLIAERLRALREQKNMSQGDIEKRPRRGGRRSKLSPMP